MNNSNVKLLEHQIRVEEKFKKFGNRVLLAWDMGTGKTVGSLHLSSQNDKIKIIITPKFLKEQWKREIIKFNFCKEEEIYLCKSKDDLNVINLERYKFIIVHYEQLRIFYDLHELFEKAFKIGILNKFVKREVIYSNIKTINDILSLEEKIIDYEVVKKGVKGVKRKEFGIIQNLLRIKDRVFLILDELYKVKNYKTNLYKSIKMFIQLFNISEIIGLDGTPFYNNVFETYNICCLLKKDVIKYNELNNYFYRGRWGEFIYKNLGNFNQILVDRIMDRVKKEEVKKFLPPLIEKDFFVENVKNLHKIKGRLIEEFNNLFEIYTTLRVFDSYFNINNLKENSKIKEVIEKYTNEGVNEEKVEVLLDFLEQIKGNKVIIFSCFLNTVNFLEKILKEKYKVSSVSSRVSEKEKNILVDNFLKGDSEILLTTDVLSKGLNATNIDYLVNFDITPSLAVMLQRNSRIHRIDSSNGKVVVNLISDVIERDILEILRKKKENFKLVVDGYESVEDDNIDINIVKEIAIKWGVPFKAVV